MLVGCVQVYHRAKETGTSSKRKRTGRPVSFANLEETRIDCLRHPRSKSPTPLLGGITEEMGYAFSPKAVQRVAQSTGYHKRIPRRKSLSSPMGPGAPLMDIWAALWIYKPPLFTAGFGHQPRVIRSPEEKYHC